MSNNSQDAPKDSLMDPKKYIKIYSACDPTPDSDIHKNNGLYYIKPHDDGPVIPAICSNGYTMIDLSLDFNLKSIPSYLSSYDYSKNDAGYIITNLDDTSTFREWWVPSDRSTRFRVAKQCKSCEQATDISDISLFDNVVYYTDSAHFCYTTYDGDNPCKDKVNKYSCNICDVGMFNQDIIRNDITYWTQCTALQTSPDTPSWHEPQMRVNRHLLYRPVMSFKRDFCTCYQNMHIPLKSHDIAINELPPITIGYNPIPTTLHVIDNVDYIDDNIKFEDVHICDPAKEDCTEQIQEIENECMNKVYYLTQNDFEDGTYRIRKCGEYIFTQDIICNFNAPTDEEENDPNFSPNRIDKDELYWFPTHAQSSHNNQYPGLYQYIGSYSLGFFAGITIEVDDVIINMNGHTLSMDNRFYLQQRFFSLIELAAKMFEPNQGPSAWGLIDEFYASNVEIKGPGTLGMSSHHGIHGNYANNIYIHDIDVSHFDVAGIACNACTDLTIENVVVGPQNNAIPTLGRYTHSRAFLPRLKHLNDKFGDKYIQFYNREETTVSVLCQRMINQMDMIYYNYINNKQYDDNNDNEWIAAKKIYSNPTGWMDGGSSYGIVLNGRGAAVVGIGARTDDVNNINMKNVEIYGIYNQAIEKIKFGLTDDDIWDPTGETFTTRGILFDAMDWLSTTDQIDDRLKTQYIGDVYTDIQFAAAKFIDSWYYRNSYWVGQQDIDFVFKGNTLETGYPFLSILPDRNDYYNDPIIRSCGTDIQLHSTKGAIGMMINGAKQSKFDNIYIHDIYNWADLGMTTCGPYQQIHITFEDIDIQFGYTGTRAHGLVIDYVSGDYTNIKIQDIESYHGEANGMTIYKESDVNLKNIFVNNINAGTQLNNQDITNLILPNYIPRACGVDIHDNTYINYIDGDDIDNLILNNIHGFQICDPFSKINDTDNYQKMFSSITVLFGLLIVIITIVLIYLLLKLCKRICYKKQRKINKNKMNENTPLLGTPKQSESIIINNRL